MILKFASIDLLFRSKAFYSPEVEPKIISQTFFFRKNIEQKTFSFPDK